MLSDLATFECEGHNWTESEPNRSKKSTQSYLWLTHGCLLQKLQDLTTDSENRCKMAQLSTKKVSCGGICFWVCWSATEFSKRYSVRLGRPRPNITREILQSRRYLLVVTRCPCCLAAVEESVAVGGDRRDRLRSSSRPRHARPCTSCRRTPSPLRSTLTLWL